MRAFVKVEYSSEGKSPAEVERIFGEAGFRRIKGAAVFEVEVASEDELDAKLEKLHEALKYSGVIYAPSLGKPPEGVQAATGGYRDWFDLWRAPGVDVDELLGLLEYDLEKFRSRAAEMMKSQIDRVATEREKEMKESDAREKLERARDRIVESAKTEGGQTFHQLLMAVGVDEEVLSQMIDELVEKGRIKAEQRGRRVVYIAS